MFETLGNLEYDLEDLDLADLEPDPIEGLYAERLQKVREILFSEVTRDTIPEKMRHLPHPPNRKIGLIAWTAYRDGLLEFAEAQGYIIGKLVSLSWKTNLGWGFVAEGNVGKGKISYIVGGLIKVFGSQPECGQLVLLTRGYASEDLRREKTVRPYEPIPNWFLD